MASAPDDIAQMREDARQKALKKVRDFVSKNAPPMSSSTIIVAANAQLLRRLYLQPARTNDGRFAKSGAAIPA